MVQWFLLDPSSAPPPAARMGQTRQNGWLWAGWLLFFLLMFLPSIWFFAVTVGEETARLVTGQAGGSLASGRALRLLARSLALGLGAAAIALVLGTTTGYLTTRIAFRGRRLFFALLLVPFFLPGYIYATAWVEWLAPELVAPDVEPLPSRVYSLPSAMLVLGLHLFPWVHLVAGAGFASIESHLEDAARLALSGAQRFARITLPLISGILASVGLFVFVVGLKNHNIPMLLRQRVFPTEIMIAYEAGGDDRQAALAGLVFVVVSLAALGLALWVALRRRRIAVEGISPPWVECFKFQVSSFKSQVSSFKSQVSGFRFQVSGFKLRRAIVPLVVLAVFVATVALPMAILIRTASGWSNYKIVLESARPQIANGLLTAAIVATLSVIVGFLLAEQIGRSGRLGAGFTITALFILFALPASVLDLGLIQFWNRSGPMGWLYDSRAMLVLGQTATFLPIAVLGLSVALRRIDPHLIEAAEMAGLPWRTVALRILWPMLRPWFIGLLAVVFVLSLNDAESAVLLAAPGRDTLSVRIMTLLHYAPDAQVSALCVIQVVVTAAAIGLVAAAAIWMRAGRSVSSGSPSR